MSKISNTARAPADSSGGLNLNDIVFILFRRKWIILLCFVIGVAAAAFLFLHQKPVYRADSKLLVRYVLENKGLVPLGENSQVRSPDSAGATIIHSEIEILTSLDLITQVADLVGPSRILKGVGEGEDKHAAAVYINKNLKVEVPPRSDIIKLTFSHPDPAVITPVLERLIELYLKRHAEIHRGLGSLELDLSQKADQLKSRLNETEDELRKLKTKAGVISLEETKNAYIEEMSNLRRELFNSEAALAEARAALAIVPTNAVVTTNLPSLSENLHTDIPIDILNQYREVVLRLGELRNRAFALQVNFSDENPVVIRARDQVARADQQRKDLEALYPSLARVPVSVPHGVPTEPSSIGLGLERTRVAALEAKVKVLKSQYDSVRLEAAKLDEIEMPLKQLQRRRDLEETNYRYFTAGLERSRFDEAVGSGRHSNISLIQSPARPRRDDARRYKIVAAAFGGAVGFGLALAFLLELIVDQSVRRVHDIDRRLHLPLFMAIPYVNGKAMRKWAKKLKRLPAKGQNGADPALSGCHSDHPMRSVFEGLRNRTLVHFKDVDRKPKLIGVCGSTEHAGSTTLAAGLAAAVSETGEGKVLLVDMHQPNAAAHPFFRGKPATEIDDVLEQDKRDVAMVQENLYVATANGHERKMSALAKQLSSLVPRFKASDYDFIIFDMPRVSPGSVSVRLGAMMDLVILVAESEKVPRRTLKQAHSLLAATGVDTQLVLNKVRSYVPGWLSGDI